VDRQDDIIGFLKKLRFNLYEGGYSSGKLLERDFYTSISFIWDDLVELYDSDLKSLYILLKYLIDEVCLIHAGENSTVNKNVFQAGTNIRSVCTSLLDGKRALDIYALNDSSWENYIIGDIHSDTLSIKQILEKTNFFDRLINGEKIRLVFLGDYVDRGKSHLKTIQTILTLKYLFPNNIILLRGNHDDGTFVDGQVKMKVRKPEKDLEDDWFLLHLFKLASINKTLPMDIIHRSLSFFDSLARLSFICYEDKIILLSHGGIPRPMVGRKDFYNYISKISDLTDVNITDYLGKSIVDNMAWSDPAIGDEDLRLDKGRFKFTEQNFDEFRELIGFDLLIRGHEVQEKGYREFFEGRLINIFSSGKILNGVDDIEEETAYS